MMDNSNGFMSSMPAPPIMNPPPQIFGAYSHDGLPIPATLPDMPGPIFSDGTLLDESTSELTGTRNAYVLLGTDTIVELATPVTGDSLAAAETAAFGDMLHAVAWRVASLEAAQEYLAAKDIPVIGRDDHTLLADPEHTFGGALRFTTWDVPGDPRA